MLVITRDPPACAQCISFDFKFGGGVPLTEILFCLENVPVLFVSCLVSDKLYSKLKRLLGLWVVGSKVISSMVFETSLWLVDKDGAFNVVGEIVYRLMVNLCLGFHLKMEEDHGF